MSKAKIPFTFDRAQFDFSILTLLSKEPFFYHVFRNLNRVEEYKLPAMMAVQIKDLTTYNLLYNPKFMETLEAEDLAEMGDIQETDLVCILKHEICHIVLRHVCDERIKHNSRIWNLATDCTINQMIGNWSPGAKKSFIFPNTLEKMINEMRGQAGMPADVTVPPDKDAVFYYNLILASLPPQELQNKDGDGDGEGEGKEGKASGKGMEKYSKNSHKNWNELDSDAREFVEENLRRIVAEAKEAAQNAGSDIGNLKGIFDSFQKTKTQNWKKILRRFASYDVSDLDYTFKRPDRRNPDMFPGKKRMETVNFVWGIDTSGSVSDDDFNRVLNELKKISKQFNKDECRIIQIDADICEDTVHSLRHIEKKFEFKGRGGTDMTPLLDRLEKEKNRIPLILFTDGYLFREIDVDNYHFPILILLTENGSENYIKGKRKRIVKVLPINKKEGN